MRFLVGALVSISMFAGLFLHSSPRVLRPSSIVANHITFRIYWDNKYPEDMVADSKSADGRLLGLTNCSDAQDRRNWIQIDPDQSFAEQQDTLWHEAHHAANNCSVGPADSTWDDIYPYLISEELELMKDNPQLVDFITRTDNGGNNSTDTH